MLGALGVVYGDIGTSPLYAMKECFSKDSPHHIAATPPNVLGILSLVFWSLTLVVTLKYLVFIMRADNEGKGGILALLALLPQKGKGIAPGALVLLVLFGASLLSGEGVITPAISRSRGSRSRRLACSPSCSRSRAASSSPCSRSRSAARAGSARCSAR